ncbi:ferrous iron transport protein A [Bacteroidota bacterium]
MFDNLNYIEPIVRLSELNRGQFGEIVSTNAKGDVRRRLLDMGLIRGVQFVVIRKAPLGDPVEIKVNGFLLSLRNEEAQYIYVKSLDQISLN